MPGAIVAYTVSCRLCLVNFAAMLLPVYKAKTEAFRANAGFDASRIRGRIFKMSDLPTGSRRFVPSGVPGDPTHAAPDMPISP